MTTRESRPGSDTRAATRQVGEPKNDGSGLRRRFAAALRLPPLDCGHRDPMACYWVDCGIAEISAIDDDDELDAWEVPDTRAMSWQERELAGAVRS